MHVNLLVPYDARLLWLVMCCATSLAILVEGGPDALFVPSIVMNGRPGKCLRSCLERSAVLKVVLDAFVSIPDAG